ncbi:hypothetical protein [Sulfurimonas sp. NWX367]
MHGLYISTSRALALIVKDI